MIFNATKVQSLSQPTDYNTNRSYLFDNLKALMIFVVVSTHYLRATNGFDVPTLSGATYLLFISFDMVLFIFISGYFSKNVEKVRKTAFRKLLFPYLVLTVFMYVVRYAIYGNANLSFINPSLALWFLLVMFYYRFFLKDLIKIKYILPISIVASVAAGLIPFFNAILALGRAFGFLPFFLLGYFFQPEHLTKIRNLPKPGIIFLAIILVVYSGFMAYEEVLPLSAWFLKSSYESIGIPVLAGIPIRSWILLTGFGWIVVFINLVPDKKTWYSSVGLNTMSVYALHLPFRHLIIASGTDFGGGLLSFIVPMLLVAVSVWILSRPIVAKGFNFVIDGLYKVISYPFIKAKHYLYSK
ncbi:MAG: acyltransferase family protein [Anaerovoracaceae bacterium]